MQSESVKVEKPIKSVNIVETQEQYLTKKFPISGDEYKVDIKRVGENNFRINFWSHIKRDSELLQLRSNKISKSYYVSLKRTNSGWIHTIV